MGRIIFGIYVNNISNNDVFSITDDVIFSVLIDFSLKIQ